LAFSKTSLPGNRTLDAHYHPQTLQKDEFPHCADFDIDAQKNQVLSCVSCENQYKLVSDICYPDDMPMKCIMFKEFLMKNKNGLFKK